MEMTNEMSREIVPGFIIHTEPFNEHKYESVKVMAINPAGARITNNNYMRYGENLHERSGWRLISMDRSY